MTFSGTILTETGIPLQGAFYALIDGDNPGILASEIRTTGSDGRFSINAPSDHYFLNVYADGFQSLVFSYADLIALNGNLILKKKASPVLLIAAAGLIAAGTFGRNATKNRRSVGAVPSEVQTAAYIAGGLIVYNLGNKLLQKFGLVSSPDTKTVLSLSSNPGSPWNPNFWQSAPGGYYSFAFTESQAGELAKQIYNAMGLFSDNVEQIFASVKQCRTQANLSFIAWKFQKMYGSDLLTYLRNGGGILPWDGISDAEIVSLNNYITSLPKY